MGLLGVPRAAAGRAQPVHHGDRVQQPGAGQVARPLDGRHGEVRAGRGGERVEQAVFPAWLGPTGPQRSISPRGLAGWQGPSSRRGEPHHGPGRVGVRAPAQRLGGDGGPLAGVRQHFDRDARRGEGSPLGMVGRPAADRAGGAQQVPGRDVEQSGRDPGTGHDDDDARGHQAPSAGPADLAAPVTPGGQASMTGSVSAAGGTAGGTGTVTG